MLGTLGRIKLKFFLIVLIILTILILVVALALFLKLKSKYKTEAEEFVEEVLKSRSFEVEDIFVIPQKLAIALNKQLNKIAIIENYNPEFPDVYDYRELMASSIINIETNGFLMKLNYRVKGETNTILIPTLSKEVKNACHEILKKILFKKLEYKYPDFKFDYFASSDWECSYIWAYDISKSAFGWLYSQGFQEHRVMNLRKEFFTIDTRYNYFELSLTGQPMQLMVYENGFLDEILSNITKTIRAYVASIDDGEIFYDNYSNIIYLTNGYSNIQSVLLDKIEEVFYYENKISFTLLNNKKVINYLCDKEFINKFENFVIGYNLRTIGNSFDYKTDRLINVNTNTKFIVDITRDRVVYCANLNKFHGFSFMTIAFSNLESADVVRTPSRNYVRIKAKDGEVLDVTCLKQEVAYYVKAQIDNIINGEQ